MANYGYGNYDYASGYNSRFPYWSGISTGSTNSASSATGSTTYTTSCGSLDAASLNFTRFNSKFSTGTSMTLNGPVTIDQEVITQALNSLVKGNSAMQGTGGAFIASSCDGKSLNPFIVVAIAMHESAGGVSNAALNKNNIGGIMGKNGLRTFDNVEQCIDSITSTVNKRVNEGYTSIGKVGKSGRYCAKSAGANWSSQVTSFAEKLRAKYEQLLSQKYGI